MKSILSDERGLVLPLVAVSAFALFGFAALAVDAGYWFGRSIIMSNVADMTAISGAKIATPLDLEDAPATLKDSVRARIRSIADANLSGAAAAAAREFSPNDLVFGCWEKAVARFTPNSNCTAGVNGIAAANAVGVRAADPDPQSFFARIFDVDPVVVPNATTDLISLQTPADCSADPNKCYAVAFKELGKACLIALNPQSEATCSTQTSSAGIDGTITLRMPDCGMHVNGSIQVSNGGSMTVHTAYLCSNAGANTQDVQELPSYLDHCGHIRDPFRDMAYATNTPTGEALPLLDAPVASRAGESITLNPGIYTKGINIGAGSVAILETGKYVIRGSPLAVSGSLDASRGVTLIFESGGTFDIQSSGNVHLIAPATGDTAGKVIIETDGSCGVSDFGGNARLHIQGAIYLRDQTLRLRGAPDASSRIESTIVVDRLNVYADAKWDVELRPSASAPLLPTRVHLVQ